MHKKVVYILWNLRVPKIAFSSSSSSFMQPCNSKPHKHIELLFYSVSDVEVQWSSSFHPSSSVFEYGYKNPTVHIYSVIDATPRESKERMQSINFNTHIQTAASCIHVQHTVSLASQRDCFVPLYCELWTSSQNSNLKFSFVVTLRTK